MNDNLALQSQAIAAFNRAWLRRERARKASPQMVESRDSLIRRWTALEVEINAPYFAFGAAPLRQLDQAPSFAQRVRGGL